MQALIVIVNGEFTTSRCRGKRTQSVVFANAVEFNDTKNSLIDAKTVVIYAT